MAENREDFREREREAAELEAEEEKTLKLTEFVTANDLAVMMDVPINKVIGTCMSIGVMVSINQRLDAETINIVADEFGFKTETWDGGEFGNGGRTVNRCTLPNRQQNAENKTESASKRVRTPVFFFCIFNIHSCTEKMNENLKKLPRREPFRE